MWIQSIVLENHRDISVLRLYIVTKLVTDPELTGAMIEAMSSYSKNYILPAYVDIALQTKVARDEESVEMMQLVLDSRVMDFGYLYCGWNGWTWKLNAMFKDPGKYMSTFEKSEKSETKAYDKIIAMFID